MAADQRDDLICPKCGAPMRTERRNGVAIELCTSCHGMFLDRGEFEQLMSAERSFLATDPPLKRPQESP